MILDLVRIPLNLPFLKNVFLSRISHKVPGTVFGFLFRGKFHSNFTCHKSHQHFL
jgi:hypothetical protein